MKRSALAVSMLLAAAVVAASFGACGGDGGGADAGVRRDGSGGPPPGKDAETESLCTGVTCGAEEPCDPADGLCKCTSESCTAAPKTVCSVSLRCVEPGDPCATKACSGTTPVCRNNGGTAVCECSPSSCGAGQSCVAGACKASSTADGGVTLSEVTVQQMNDREAAGHAAFATYPNNRVHFKAVVASPIFRDYKKSSGTDPTAWYCRMGLFLADATATAAEHNGILLLSKSTVTAEADGSAGDCAKDSPLELLQATGGSLEIGEELEITGFFKEDCYRTDLSGPCDNKDQNGKDLARAVVEQNAKTGGGAPTLVRTGNKPGLPSSLPVVVSVDDIASGARSGTAAPYTTEVGPKWHDYRQVLVKVENVKVSTAAAPAVGCTWYMTPQAGSTVLAAQYGVMYQSGTNCPGTPAAGTNLSAVSGFETWFTSSTKAETQLAPRGASDIVAQ